MRIKYKAICFYCKNTIEPPNGFLHRAKGRRYAHCLERHDKKKIIKTKKM